MNKEFNSLTDEILEVSWKASPVRATVLGVHNHDDQLDKTDSESRRQYLRKAKDYLRKLDRFSSDMRRRKARLSKDKEMDLKILRNSLEVEIVEEQEIGWLNRLPLVYPRTALMGCYVLIMRDFAPLSRRMKSVLGRLRQIPRLMIEGQKNLGRGKNIPRIWTQIGIDTTAGGREFFRQTIPGFAEKVPRLKKELLAANRKAIAAFEEYEHFLKRRLLLRSSGRFAIGEELFNLL